MQMAHKTNTFTLTIRRNITQMDADLIISCFDAHGISSSDFTLNHTFETRGDITLYGTFPKRRDFVITFCLKQCKLSIPKNRLIKLWKALNATYNLFTNGPCTIHQQHPSISNTKSSVFIPKHITKRILEQHTNLKFDTTQRLYQYLNLTIKMSRMSHFEIMLSTANGIKAMMINSELCDEYNNELYILCIRNDIVKQNSFIEEWQFVSLITDKTVMELTSSNGNISLPYGVRSYSDPFYRTLQTKASIKQQKISCGQYEQLKRVKTAQKSRKLHYMNANEQRKCILKITSEELGERIHCALRSNDPTHNLIPIVSILSGVYYVDQLLPVRVDGEWIGIVYRDKHPISILIDRYDIINKAMLCNPWFDPQSIEWFVNDIYDIVILRKNDVNDEGDIHTKVRENGLREDMNDVVSVDGHQTMVYVSNTVTNGVNTIQLNGIPMYGYYRYIPMFGYVSQPQSAPTMAKEYYCDDRKEDYYYEGCADAKVRGNGLAQDMNGFVSMDGYQATAYALSSQHIGSTLMLNTVANGNYGYYTYIEQPQTNIEHKVTTTKPKFNIDAEEFVPQTKIILDTIMEEEDELKEETEEKEII